MKVDIQSVLVLCPRLSSNLDSVSTEKQKSRGFYPRDFFIDIVSFLCYKRVMKKEFGADFLRGVYRYNILINKEKFAMGGGGIA